VVGSVNLDQSFTVGALPQPGETVLASSLSAAPGGKGGNQAVAAARTVPPSNSSPHSVTTPPQRTCAPICSATTSALTAR